MSFNLPREIIKWIQGLDLSYSVVDYKRDLNDGFLVAEIFSRYFPEKMTQDDIERKRYMPLSMHMFDHSQKLDRKKNNWHLLELFFIRNNQLGNEMPFTKKDLNDIPNNNFEQLRTFLCKLYTFLTSKKIIKPPLASLIQTEKAFVSTGQTQLDQHGASYILTEKGLEKLDNKEGKEEEKQNSNIKINETGQSKDPYPVGTSMQSKKTAFLRNYSKPIGQAQEASAMQIDVKNIAVRPVQMPVAKLKEKKDFLGPSKQNLSDSFRKSGQMEMHQTGQYSSEPQQKKDKKMSEKTIYDILNEMITDKFKISEFQQELTKVKVLNNTLIQAYIDNIEIFSDEFSIAFFNEIFDSLPHILQFMSKDPNEHWKCMNFMFICLKGLGPDKECFRLLIKIINQFGQLSLNSTPIVGQRTKIYFKESILPVLALQIKNSLIFERKEMLIQILYSYCGKDSQSKHEIISQYKDQIKNMHLFMQSLVVLFKYETVATEENKIIIDDMMHYAKINLFSASTDLRTTSLALLCQIADLNYELLETYLEDKVMELAKYDWWETKCLVVMLFSKLIQGIINSATYQALVKQSSTIHKQYSTENEEKIAQLKRKIERFATGIRIVAFPPASELVLRTTFIYIIDLVGESRDLLELFTNLLIMCSSEMRKWVLSSEPPQPNEIQERYLILSDKSLKYQIVINSENLKQYSHQILDYIVQQINEYKDEKIDSLTQEYMDIILFAFTYTDFKLVNMEQCEHIANTLKEYIFLALCEEDMCQQAKIVMEKLMKLKFFSEVNIPDSERLLCSAICLIYQNKSEFCMQVIEEILVTMVNDAENGIDVIKRFLVDVYKGLSDRLNDQQKNANINFEQLMESTNLREIFMPIEKMIQLQVETQLAAKKARESAVTSSKASVQGDKSQDDIQNQSQHSQKSYASSNSKNK